ncbi:hypothetical protein [Zunongwangia sp. H14]|uniref:hypothetical protein n=1 Tax=Zunongwangia sp. H14 TaxID=3240792 RepID=UPI0035661035
MGKVLSTKNLEHATLEFYNNYVIAIVKEDVVVGRTEVNSYIKACTNFFCGTTFVYISLRKNAYNVNPVIYSGEMRKLKNLAGMAIVCHQPSKINTAKYERNFVNFPYEIFTSLDDALEWSAELTKE